MHTRLIVPLALALQCSAVLAQVPANFYREDARSLVGGQTPAGATGYSNFTPHTGAQTQVFTHGDSGGRATETVTFDSDPAPLVRVSAEAWRQPEGQSGAPFSAIQADLSYGFTVSGPADALVPVRFRGRYEISNDNFLTYTFASVAFSTSGMDFSRPDHVGLFAQCDGASVGYRCYADHSGWPTLNSSIQSTMRTLGFESELAGLGGAAHGADIQFGSDPMAFLLLQRGKLVVELLGFRLVLGERLFKWLQALAELGETLVGF